MIKQLLLKLGYHHVSTIQYGWRNCIYCGVDIAMTSWATSVETHERNCAFTKVKNLTSERDLYLETLRQIKRVDTKTCILVTQTLNEVRKK